MAIKIQGSTGTTVDATSAGEMKVSLSNTDANIGGVRLMSENDDGTITGTAYLKSPETSPDYRLRVGVDTILFEDTFNATAQNTNLWSYTLNTLSVTQPGAGTVNFSTVQGTTSAHGAFMRTYQYFPLKNTAPLAAEFYGGQFNAVLVAGEVVLFGVGLPTAATTRPGDGVWFKFTTAGLIGVLSYSGNEVESGVLKAFDTFTVSDIDKFLIIVGEREVEFWLNDAFLGHLDIPAANGIPFIQASLPLFLMKYNTGNVTNTNTYRFCKVGATLLDVASNKPYAHIQAGMGMHASVGQNGHTMGLTAGNFGGTAAIPTTQAGSNTTPNAAMAGLGGVFQMTTQASAAGASGDMVASYFLNPIPSVNITGRNLIISGVKISCINYGAATATTPTTLLWGLAYGSVNVSLASTETASFATGTTHSPRKIPLGFCSSPVGAAVGAPYDRDVSFSFDAPIVIRPGEYIETTVRFIVGTATASQTVLYTVAFDGFWE